MILVSGGAGFIGSNFVLLDPDRPLGLDGWWSPLVPQAEVVRCPLVLGAGRLHRLL